MQRANELSEENKKARENADDYNATGFCFASDWLRVVRVSGPVTHRAMQSKAKQSGGHFRHSIENCSSLTCFTFGSLYILSCRLIEAVRGVLQKILLASRTTRSMSTPKMQEIR